MSRRENDKKKWGWVGELRGATYTLYLGPCTSGSRVDGLCPYQTGHESEDTPRKGEGQEEISTLSCVMVRG